MVYLAAMNPSENEWFVAGRLSKMSNFIWLTPPPLKLRQSTVGLRPRLLPPSRSALRKGTAGAAPLH